MRDDLFSLNTRFWKRVPINRPDQCWEWSGGLNFSGYGVIWGLGGKAFLAHRYMWKLHNGADAPRGMHVCHSCDNRKCVNPAHLWLGTPRENALDMVAKGRGNKPLTHCRRGHEYTAENTLTLSSGRRDCRACNKLRRQRAYANRRAKFTAQKLSAGEPA